MGALFASFTGDSCKQNIQKKQLPAQESRKATEERRRQYEVHSARDGTSFAAGEIWQTYGDNWRIPKVMCH